MVVKEDYAIVLDFLPNGYPSDTRPMHMKTPIAQAIGKEHLEVESIDQAVAELKQKLTELQEKHLTATGWRETSKKRDDDAIAGTYENKGATLSASCSKHVKDKGWCSMSFVAPRP